MTCSEVKSLEHLFSPLASEADLMYQDQPGSGESDSDHSFNSALSEHESLVSVVIHGPDRAQHLQDLPQPSGSLWAPSPGP